MKRGVAKYPENDSRIVVTMYTSSWINALENDTVSSLSLICSTTF